MPLVEANSIQITSGQLAAAGLSGSNLVQMATAIGTGFTLSLRAVTVVTADVGTLGAGVGTGIPALEPTSVIQIFTSSFVSNDIKGASSIQLATGCALSLVSIVSTAVSSTAHATVGTGTGVLSVIPTSTAVGILTQSLAASAMVGSSAVNMARAIGFAFESSVPLITGPIAIVGPPSIIPSSGIGTGIFL